MTHWAFLGAGAMAGAIVRSLIAGKVAEPEAIRCIGGNDPTAANLAKDTGVTAVDDFLRLLDGADVLVVACKPQNLRELPPEIAAHSVGRLVISIVAGKTLSTLWQIFPKARNIVRVMPNTPAQIGSGMSGWCVHQPLTDADSSLVAALLGAMGEHVQVDESDMDAVTAVSGSGPAYVFEFAAALQEAGIAAGLSEDVARQLAQQTILGAAQLLKLSNETAETLRDRVTSPNGTTFAALQVMQDRNFRKMIDDAVAAAAARSRELSGD